jgi:hypothetical protein
MIRCVNFGAHMHLVAYAPNNHPPFFFLSHACGLVECMRAHTHTLTRTHTRACVHIHMLAYTDIRTLSLSHTLPLPPHSLPLSPPPSLLPRPLRDSPNTSLPPAVSQHHSPEHIPQEDSYVSSRHRQSERLAVD